MKNQLLKSQPVKNRYAKNPGILNLKILPSPINSRASLLLSIFAAIFTVATLTSCSFFGSDDAEEDQVLSRQDRTKKNKRIFTKNTSDIRLVWSIPQEPVDGFILNVSYSGSISGSEINIPVKELEKLDHPKYGFVFGYTLKNVLSTEGLRVTARSYKDDEVSPPGLVYAVGE